MNRMTIALAIAAGLGLFAGNALADPGGFVPPSGCPGGMPSGFGQFGGPGTLLGAGDVPPNRAPDMYGWSPCLKKLFHRGEYSSGAVPPNGKNPLQNPANWAAGGYGMGGPAYNPYGFPPGYGPYGSMGPNGPNGYGPNGMGPNGPMMQGTLVFPNQPFTRSPRDYFMMDLNK